MREKKSWITDRERVKKIASPIGERKGVRRGEGTFTSGAARKRGGYFDLREEH